MGTWKKIELRDGVGERNDAERSRIFRRCGSRDNLHQFSCDDGLPGTIEEDLESGDHVSSVLRGVLSHDERQYPRQSIRKMHRESTHFHGVSSRRLLARVSLGEGPVQRIGESVLSQVDEDLVVDLKGGEVG